ncbi:MAG: SUF system Fe-S cluster assembly protein [Pseudomonadota bacterium]
MSERDILELEAVNEPPASAAEGAAEPVKAADLSEEELNKLTDAIVTALKTVYDPEIPVDIYELGLIYKVDFEDGGVVAIQMTLTAPGCPVAGEMPGWVQQAVERVDGVNAAKVEMTFDPPWSPAMMSDEAKLELNMF